MKEKIRSIYRESFYKGVRFEPNSDAYDLLVNKVNAVPTANITILAEGVEERTGGDLPTAQRRYVELRIVIDDWFER